MSISTGIGLVGGIDTKHNDPHASRDAVRRSRYKELLSYYEGSQWLGSPLPAERRLTMNYVRGLVRKSISYLFPEPVTLSVYPHPEADEGARRAEAALAQAAQFNDLASLDHLVALDAAVLGDGAFRLGWDPVAMLPLVTAVDVQGLSCWWQADNPRVITRVVQRTLITQSEAVERWGMRQTVAPTSEAEAGTVALVEDWRPDKYTIHCNGFVVKQGANPYGWIPYVVFPNARRPQQFWGESDLVDLIEPTRELNARLSVVSRVLELSGNPIAVLENVESAAGIVAKPGAMWELPENAKAYLLDLLSGGGVRLHMDYIEVLYRVIHDLAETPRTAFGDSGRTLSGAALEVEVQPLVQKVKRKRQIWSNVYAQRGGMMLDLMQRFGGADFGAGRRVRAVWPQILPSDRGALVQDEVALTGGSAVPLSSHTSSLTRLGYEDPAAELARMEQERRAYPLLFTPPSPADSGAGSPVESIGDGDEGQG